MRAWIYSPSSIDNLNIAKANFMVILLVISIEKFYLLEAACTVIECLYVQNVLLRMIGYVGLLLILKCLIKSK